MKIETGRETAPEIIPVGIAEALSEITRRNQFDQAERRLAEKIKPARLAPAQEPSLKP